MPSDKNYLPTLWEEVRRVNPRTELECSTAGIPCLTAMTKTTDGKEQMLLFLATKIAEFNKMLNIENVMSREMIMMTAEFILEEFGLLNIADIRLVFIRALKGEYGKIYNRICVQNIMEMFRQYFNDRCNLAAEQSELESQQWKEDGRTSDKVLSIINNARQ